MREPLKVAVGKRGIGCDDDHTGAVRARLRQLVLEIILAERLADRHPRHLQHAAVVGLDEDPHGPAAEVPRELARAGPNATLPVERDGPRAGADRAFLHRAFARDLDRGYRVRWSHMAPADVVQSAVV